MRFCFQFTRLFREFKMNFEFLGVIFAGIFGAVWGSFSVAQVWRIRAKQLFAEDEKSLSEEEKTEKNRLKSLEKISHKNDRSHCLNCGYVLRVFDLVPIFSWIFLLGKCRSCRTPIGSLEFLAEVFTAVIFAVLVFFLNLAGWDFAKIFALFVAILPLAILLIYDIKWGLLPTKLLWVFLILAGGFWIFSNFGQISSSKVWLNLAISALTFPAIYWALATFSKEKLVGGGDWILALGLIFLLEVRSFNGILMMFLSNVLALVAVILVSVFRRTSIKKNAQIPFGPAMIVAGLILLILGGIFEKIFAFLV